MSDVRPIGAPADRRPARSTGTSPTGTSPTGTGPIGTGPTGTGPIGTGPTGTGPIGTGPTGTSPTGTSPLVSVRGLAVGYPGVRLLADLDFSVYPGEVFGVLGGSGSGKSTLLKHMIGLLPPLAGSVEIGGVDIVTARGTARQALLRRIGVMYQSGALFGSMTLLENVCLPLEEHTSLPRRALELTALLKLRLVGLSGAEHHRPADISGGMRKRAAIARAMALDPEVLFLDEPSAGLDPVTSAELDALIAQLARSLGITFVIVTHELNSIHRVTDRVIMLDREAKGIVAMGTPAELTRSQVPSVARFFSAGAPLRSALREATATPDKTPTAIQSPLPTTHPTEDPTPDSTSVPTPDPTPGLDQEPST